MARRLNQGFRNLKRRLTKTRYGLSVGFGFHSQSLSLTEKDRIPSEVACLLEILTSFTGPEIPHTDDFTIFSLSQLCFSQLSNSVQSYNYFVFSSAKSIISHPAALDKPHHGFFGVVRSDT